MKNTGSNVLLAIVLAVARFTWRSHHADIGEIVAMKLHGATADLCEAARICGVDTDATAFGAVFVVAELGEGASPGNVGSQSRKGNAFGEREHGGGDDISIVGAVWTRLKVW